MMYQQFFGFNEAPFNLTPDSKFLFLSHRHQEALAAMLFGVQDRKGFICLTGEIGCGKTTLCRAMLSQLDHEKVKVCLVLNSYLTDLELLKTINEGFGLDAESDSKKRLLDTLNIFLLEQFEQGNNIVLVIDESQNLRPETLEQIRMISNLETETDKLIQIMLIGQPELRRTLALPELEQLNQRITVRYHIAPLDQNEIPEYIRHRLSVAEPQMEIDFSSKAIQLIHHYSRGVPRRINVLCDRCLLIAYTQGTASIDDKIAQQAAREIRGETEGATGSISTAGGETAGANRQWLATVGMWAGVFVLIVGAIYLGTWLAGLQGGGAPDDDGRLAQATPMPTPVVTALATATPRPTAEPTAVPTAQPTATPTPQPTATPTPIPTPSPTPFRYENWQVDTDDQLRVRDVRLSEAASYINLLKMWGIEIDLTNFRAADPADVADFDMLRTIEPLNFAALTTDELMEALRLDLPVLVRMREEGEPAQWGVVSSMRGEMLTLIDPISGRSTVRRGTLAERVDRAIVPFIDEPGFAGLGAGAEGESVQLLQAWLTSEGYYQGTADGRFGPRTQDALRDFQGAKGLPQTGEVDAATAAAIFAERTARRPRLYS